MRQQIKLNKIIQIDHATPRKFQYVNKLHNLSSHQQSTFVKIVPETSFGYPEAICGKGTPSKPEVNQRNDRVNKPPSWLTL